jgi:two-component sensor histidine kinase
LVRITRFDVPDMAAGYMPPIVAQLLFAVLCTLVTVALHSIVQLVWPGPVLVVLIFPSILVATLFGRWQAGVMAHVLNTVYALYLVSSDQTAVAAPDIRRIVLSVILGAFIIVLAELFRRSMRSALKTSEMLVLEMEHRVKNSFGAIASILSLQMRRASSEEAKEALRTALGRVDSYSRAYGVLYRGVDQTGGVDVRAYLGELCEALDRSLGQPRISIKHELAPARLPRGRATTLGLLVNEVVTNSVKHAFPDDRRGEVLVRFADRGPFYELVIGDDGAGMTGPPRPGSLGLQLIDYLTEQSGGSLVRDSGPAGTTFRFQFRR